MVSNHSKISLVYRRICGTQKRSSLRKKANFHTLKRSTKKWYRDEFIIFIPLLELRRVCKVSPNHFFAPLF